MAEIRQVTPPEAKGILDNTPEAVYLDVRTPEEFAAGHPAGAINIPAFLRGPQGMSANDEFLPVVEKILPKDRPILCGCQAGGRSMKAAQILAGAGYHDVRNVEGGFGGARDGAGRVVVPGWGDSGLPVSSDTRDAVSWEGLRRRAGAQRGLDRG